MVVLQKKINLLKGQVQYKNIVVHSRNESRRIIVLD